MHIYQRGTRFWKDYNCFRNYKCPSKREEKQDILDIINSRYRSTGTKAITELQCDIYPVNGWDITRYIRVIESRGTTETAIEGEEKTSKTLSSIIIQAYELFDEGTGAKG